jgi:cytochrome c
MHRRRPALIRLALPLVALPLALAFGVATAVAESPRAGQPITEADIAAWNIEALPDGKGLPPGSGTVKQGAAVYSQKCALCHGENGVSPRPGYSPMVGPSKFDRIDTMKTVPYYKYATTLFDVMRRSMPYPIPKTLTGDELYALSAYILFLNKIVPEDAVMDAKSLPQVKMPNRDNFLVWDPNKIEYDPLRMDDPPR